MVVSLSASVCSPLDLSSRSIGSSESLCVSPAVPSSGYGVPVPFQQRADETSSLHRASSDATLVCEPHCAYDVASLQIDCSSSLPAIHRSGLAARSSPRPSVLSQFVCLFCLRGLALAWLWDSEPLRVMDVRWTLSAWNLGSSVRYSRSTYWAEKGAVASRRPRKRAKTATRLQGCLRSRATLAVRLSEFSSPSGEAKNRLPRNYM